jgi:hypothetical protein
MKLILPLSVTIPRKTKADKVFMLNLNIYRNAHHFVMNQAKVMWKEIVKVELENTAIIIPEPPYRFVYTVYPGSGRKFDLGNVLPAVQKFTDDALIELGVISDDSYKIVKAIDYRLGEINKENARVELDILSY